MAHIAITFDELINRFPDPEDISPLLDFDDIDESLDIMEKCLELYDTSMELAAYESVYTCAKALASEDKKWEKIKETVKKLWLTTIDYINKAGKFAISIINWPSRLIPILFARYKKREIDRAIWLRHDGIEIITSLESMAESIDDIKKEQEKIISEYNLDLDIIRKYIERCEEKVDSCYKQNLNIIGKSVSFDETTKVITETLKERTKTIQRRSDLLHKVIMKNTKPYPISMKTKKILDVLNNVADSHKNTLAIALSMQKIESILRNVLDRLALLKGKIENCTYEDMNVMKVEEKESVHYTLSLIRTYITDFTALNINISKYFRSIDAEIEKIDTIARFVNDSFTDDMVVETIGDIKVVVDDLFVCLDAHGRFINDEEKRSIVESVNDSYFESKKDRSLKYNGNFIKLADDHKNYLILTISEGIYYLSLTNKPNHLKNLYVGISQESQTKWYNYLVGTNNTGLTRDQSIQLQLWYEKREYPRLLKAYKEYLKNLGISEIGIIKPGRLQLGVKFRHHL